MKTGMHTKFAPSIGDVYRPIAEEILKTRSKGLPQTAEEKMSEIV